MRFLLAAVLTLLPNMAAAEVLYIAGQTWDGSGFLEQIDLGPLRVGTVFPDPLPLPVERVWAVTSGDDQGVYWQDATGVWRTDSYFHPAVYVPHPTFAQQPPPYRLFRSQAKQCDYIGDPMSGSIIEIPFDGSPPAYRAVMALGIRGLTGVDDPDGEVRLWYTAGSDMVYAVSNYQATPMVLLRKNVWLVDVSYAPASVPEPASLSALVLTALILAVVEAYRRAMRWRTAVVLSLPAH